MASLSWPILLTFAISVLLGALLVRRGRRGRRLHDHPLCAKCGYDLFGRPGEAARCPECGGDLSKAKAVRVGAYQRRWGLILAGYFVWLIGGGLVAIELVGRHYNVDWHQYKPVGWLTWNAARASSSTYNPAIEEIIRRMDKARLSYSQMNDLALVGLKVQGDLTKPWHWGWGEIISKADSQGLLSPAQKLQYLEQAADYTLSVVSRKRVVIGEPIPLGLQIHDQERYGGVGNTRFASPTNSSNLSTILRLTAKCPHSFSLTGLIVDDGEFSDFETRLTQPVQGFVSRILNTPQPTEMVYFVDVLRNRSFDIKSGHHRVQSEVSYSIWSDSYQFVPTSFAPKISTKLEYSRTKKFETEIEFVEPGIETVALVKDPTLKPRFEFEVLLKGGATLKAAETLLSVQFRHSPVDISFDVHIRAKGREVNAGVFPKFVNGHPEKELSAVLELPEGFVGDGDRVDVILIPNTVPARQTIYIDKIWGETMEFKDVPVRADTGKGE